MVRGQRSGLDPTRDFVNMMCVEVIAVTTNLQLDDRLITRATKLGNHRTKRAAVTQALVEYIRHLEQEKITAMFGTIEYDPSYHYKKQRTRG
jgi:Arc/MetJ family transcription regulator